MAVKCSLDKRVQNTFENVKFPVESIVRDNTSVTLNINKPVSRKEVSTYIADLNSAFDQTPGFAKLLQHTKDKIVIGIDALDKQMPVYKAISEYVDLLPNNFKEKVRQLDVPQTVKHVLENLDSFYQIQDTVFTYFDNDDRDKVLQGLRQVFPAEYIVKTGVLDTAEPNEKFGYVFIKNPFYNEGITESVRRINAESKDAVDDIINHYKDGAHIWFNTEDPFNLFENTDEARGHMQMISNWLSAVIKDQKVLDKEGNVINNIGNAPIGNALRMHKGGAKSFFNAIDMVFNWSPQTYTIEAYEELGHVIELFSAYSPDSDLRKSVEAIYEKFDELLEVIVPNSADKTWHAVYSEEYNKFFTLHNNIINQQYVKGELTGVLADYREEVQERALRDARREVVAKMIGHALRLSYGAYRGDDAAYKDAMSFHSINDPKAYKDSRLRTWYSIVAKVRSMWGKLLQFFSMPERKEAALKSLYNVSTSIFGKVAADFYYNGLDIPVSYEEREELITAANSLDAEVRKLYFEGRRNRIKQIEVLESVVQDVIKKVEIDIRNIESRITSAKAKIEALTPNLEESDDVADVLDINDTIEYALINDYKRATIERLDDLKNTVDEKAGNVVRNPELLLSITRLEQLLEYLGATKTLKESAEELDNLKKLLNEIRRNASAQMYLNVMSVYIQGAEVEHHGIPISSQGVRDQMRDAWGKVMEIIIDNDMLDNSFNIDPMQFLTHSLIGNDQIVLKDFIDELDRKQQIKDGVINPGRSIVNANLSFTHLFGILQFFNSIKESHQQILGIMQSSEVVNLLEDYGDQINTNIVNENIVHIQRGLDNFYNVFFPKIATAVIYKHIYMNNRDNQGRVRDWNLEELLQNPEYIDELTSNVTHLFSSFTNIRNLGNELWSRIVDDVAKHASDSTVESQKAIEGYKNQLSPLRQKAVSDPIVEKETAKFGSNTVEEMLQERNRHGEKTQFWLSPYELGNHQMDLREFKMEMYNALKAKYKELLPDEIMPPLDPNSASSYEELMAFIYNEDKFELPELVRANLKRIHYEYQVREYLKYWQIDQEALMEAEAMLKVQWESHYADNYLAEDVSETAWKKFRGDNLYTKFSYFVFDEDSQDYRLVRIPKTQYIIPSLIENDSFTYYLDAFDPATGEFIKEDDYIIYKGNSPVTVKAKYNKKQAYTTDKLNYSNQLLERLKGSDAFMDYYNKFMQIWSNTQNMYTKHLGVYDRYFMPGNLQDVTTSIMDMLTITPKVFSNITKLLHTAKNKLFLLGDYSDWGNGNDSQKFEESVVPIPSNVSVAQKELLNNNSLDTLFKYVHAVYNYRNKVEDHASIYSIYKALETFSKGTVINPNKDATAQIKENKESAFTRFTDMLSAHFYNRSVKMQSYDPVFIRIWNFSLNILSHAFIRSDPVFIPIASLVAMAIDINAKEYATYQSKGKSKRLGLRLAKQLGYNLNMVKYGAVGLLNRKGLNIPGKLGTIMKFGNIYDVDQSTYNLYSGNNALKKVVEKVSNYGYLQAASLGLNIDIAANELNGFRPIIIKTMSLSLDQVEPHFHIEWKTFNQYKNYRLNQEDLRNLTTKDKLVQIEKEFASYEDISFYNLMKDDKTNYEMDMTLDNDKWMEWIQTNINNKDPEKQALAIQAQQMMAQSSESYNINNSVNPDDIDILSQSSQALMKKHNMLLTAMMLEPGKANPYYSQAFRMKGYIAILMERIFSNHYDSQRMEYVTNGLFAWIKAIGKFTFIGTAANLIFAYISSKVDAGPNTNRDIMNFKNSWLGSALGTPSPSKKAMEDMVESHTARWIGASVMMGGLVYLSMGLIARYLMQMKATPCPDPKSADCWENQNIWYKRMINTIIIMTLKLQNDIKGSMTPIPALGLFTENTFAAFNSGDWGITGTHNWGPDKGKYKIVTTARDKFLMMRHINRILDTEAGDLYIKGMKPLINVQRGPADVLYVIPSIFSENPNWSMTYPAQDKMLEYNEAKKLSMTVQELRDKKERARKAAEAEKQRFEEWQIQEGYK